MGASQKPRRKYNPNRWLQRAAQTREKRADAAPLTDGQQLDLGLSFWLSFEAMLREPSEAMWSNLACALNIGLVLSERGVGAECESDFKVAQEALMRARKRYTTSHSWALDADGIKAIRSALEIHDEQTRIAERGEMRAAVAEVYRRVGAGDVFEVA
jgi:hypothetical protein